MYLEHFGFRHQPFGTTPDPRFLYFSPQHAEALAALHYGLVERRGLLALIGPCGTGKTSLLYHLLGLWKGRAETAFVFHPPETREQMLVAVLEDLGLAWPGTYREGCRSLQARAIEARQKGRRLILIFDEAQGMSSGVLEDIRLLTNFEKPDEKLLEIILAGQPTLDQRLASPECEQFRQRLAITARIGRLESGEVRRYVEHRLRVAGLGKKNLLTSGAFTLLAAVSGGVPRIINAICFEALSAACAQGKKRIDAQEIARSMLAVCAHDASLASIPRKPPAGRAVRRVAGAAAIVLASLTTPAYLYWYWRNHHLVSTEAASPHVVVETQSAVVAAAPPPEPAAPPGEAIGDQQEAASETLPLQPELPQEQVRVQRSDTLRQIALRQYGRWDSRVWSHIQKHNQWLRDPNRLEAGRLLVLPPWQVQNAAGASSP